MDSYSKVSFNHAKVLLEDEDEYGDGADHEVEEKRRK